MSHWRVYRTGGHQRNMLEFFGEHLQRRRALSRHRDRGTRAWTQVGPRWLQWRIQDLIRFLGYAPDWMHDLSVIRLTCFHSIQSRQNETKLSRYSKTAGKFQFFFEHSEFSNFTKVLRISACYELENKYHFILSCTPLYYHWQKNKIRTLGVKMWTFRFERSV